MDLLYYLDKNGKGGLKIVITVRSISSTLGRNDHRFPAANGLSSL